MPSLVGFLTAPLRPSYQRSNKSIQFSSLLEYCSDLHNFQADPVKSNFAAGLYKLRPPPAAHGLIVSRSNPCHTQDRGALNLLKWIQKGTVNFPLYDPNFFRLMMNTHQVGITIKHPVAVWMCLCLNSFI